MTLKCGSSIRVDILGEAKITKQGSEVIGDQDIGGLDIPVNQSLVVEVCNSRSRFCDLRVVDEHAVPMPELKAHISQFVLVRILSQEVSQRPVGRICRYETKNTFYLKGSEEW